MLKKRITCAALLLGLLAPCLSALDFNPAGWETNGNYPLIGSPEAKKGGALRSTWLDFPPTLRALGPNSNTSANRALQGMVYESLLSLHPETLEYMPALADYWKISPDKRKFSFHINPKARWADGSPVTAADVVASWEFKVRKDIKDPYSYMMWSESYERPVAESPDARTCFVRNWWRAARGGEIDSPEDECAVATSAATFGPDIRVKDLLMDMVTSAAFLYTRAVKPPEEQEEVQP